MKSIYLLAVFAALITVSLVVSVPLMMDADLTISSWPDGVMTPVADQLPLPNEVSVGIAFETSPVMLVSAVAVSAIFVMFAIFNGPGPPGILSVGFVHKTNRNCLINGINTLFLTIREGIAYSIRCATSKITLPYPLDCTST